MRATSLFSILLCSCLVVSACQLGAGQAFDSQMALTDGGSGGEGGVRRDSGGNRDGGGTFPDVVAEEEGYLVNDETGSAGLEGSGNMPQGDPQSSAQITDFSGNTTFIPGGTNRFTGSVVNGSINGLIVGFDELPGFYEISASSPFAFYVTLGQDVRRSSLTLVIVPKLAVNESQPNGGYGQAYRVPCTVTQVGTGDLQVSLSWGTDTDVDLHLVEPSGEEIFYGNLESSAGGELDLDSNPDCRIDNINNENITYQGVVPPPGHYIVRVDYWESCSEYSTTHYVVTVNLRGTPTVYEGSFEASDADQGGEGSGFTIAEFDF